MNFKFLDGFECYIVGEQAIVATDLTMTKEELEIFANKLPLMKTVGSNVVFWNMHKCTWQESTLCSHYEGYWVLEK